MSLAWWARNAQSPVGPGRPHRGSRSTAAALRASRRSATLSPREISAATVLPLMLITQNGCRSNFTDPYSLPASLTTPDWPVWVRCGGAGFVYRGSASPSIAAIMPHRREPPLGANCRLLRCSKPHCYSMISSARPRSDCGTVIPSALAVLRLMSSSSLVAC
jgi:hypothetical protein